MTSLLQRPQCSTQTESKVFRHSHADNHVRFLCAVSMLRHGSEGHTDQAFLVEKLGEQIDVQRGNGVGEDHQPVVAVFDLADSPSHRFPLLEVKS